MNNWKTTAYGWASKIFLGIIVASAVQPALIDDAFGSFSGRVKAWSALLWFILSSAKDYYTADKKPTL